MALKAQQASENTSRPMKASGSQPMERLGVLLVWCVVVRAEMLRMKVRSVRLSMIILLVCPYVGL